MIWEYWIPKRILSIMSRADYFPVNRHDFIGDARAKYRLIEYARMCWLSFASNEHLRSVYVYVFAMGANCEKLKVLGVERRKQCLLCLCVGGNPAESLSHMIEYLDTNVPFSICLYIYLVINNLCA